MDQIALALKQILSELDDKCTTGVLTAAVDSSQFLYAPPTRDIKASLARIRKGLRKLRGAGFVFEAIEGQQIALALVRMLKEVDDITIALVRMLNELEDIRRNPLKCCTAGPDGDMFCWKAVICGPLDSPFSGGSFIVTIDLPVSYPLQSPKVSFKTKIFHPNIKHDRSCRLGILQENWSPGCTISMVLESIHSLLANPNLDDPVDPNIAEMYKCDKVKYEATARSWTQKYASAGVYAMNASSRQKAFGL